jgi:chromosome segregation ATPase
MQGCPHTPDLCTQAQIKGIHHCWLLQAAQDELDALREQLAALQQHLDSRTGLHAGHLDQKADSATPAEPDAAARLASLEEQVQELKEQQRRLEAAQQQWATADASCTTLDSQPSSVKERYEIQWPASVHGTGYRLDTLQQQLLDR